MDAKRLEQLTDLIMQGAKGLAEMANAKMQEAIGEAEKMSPENAKLLKERFDNMGINKQVDHMKNTVNDLKSHLGGK